jgi:putative ABC transport system substrate-binding protein
MRRRAFVQLAAGAAVAAPGAARAQPKTMKVIGQLNGGVGITPDTEADWKPYLDAAREALGENGYILGQNVTIEWRSADGHYDRLPALAADLVARKVDLIETNGNIGALAAKAATSTIPIVFNSVSRPVENGFIASLARPGGNMTGVTNFGGELAPKYLDLLLELIPNASKFGLLVNQDFPKATEYFIRNVGEAVKAKGLKLTVQKASTASEIDAAFAAFAEAKPDALVITADVFYLQQVRQLVALAAHHALPAIYYNIRYPRAGGLICYGIDEVAMFGRAFYYAGKILNGADPAEMPVERPAKFLLGVNLKTAAQLGLTVPASILAQATEVIE